MRRRRRRRHTAAGLAINSKAGHHRARCRRMNSRPRLLPCDHRHRSPGCCCRTGRCANDRSSHRPRRHRLPCRRAPSLADQASECLSPFVRFPRASEPSTRSPSRGAARCTPGPLFAARIAIGSTRHFSGGAPDRQTEAERRGDSARSFGPNRPRSASSSPAWRRRRRSARVRRRRKARASISCGRV